MSAFSFALVAACLFLGALSFELPELSAELCSGNGYFYEEDTLLGMAPMCECLGCFKGAKCHDVDESCTVNSLLVDESGFGAWFRNYAYQNSSMSMGPYYHYNYLAAPAYLTDGTHERITDALKAAIYNLHAKVGNRDLQKAGYKIVTGAGALQIVSSLVYMLGKRRGMKVYCEPPYFDEFPNIANMIGNTSFTTAKDLKSDDVIEIITHPNNPDGMQYPSRYPKAVQIHDYVYSWPHMTTVVPEAAPIMVFSLSKLSGYAATRFGWALVQDEALAEGMAKYIFVNGQGAGIESKYHATRIIQSITNSVGTPNDFFYLSRDVVSKRWIELRATFAHSKKYSLNKTVPGMPYAWVTCSGTKDCVQDFKDAKIDVGEGRIFGSDNQHNIRLVVMQEQPTFDLMIKRIKALVGKEREREQAGQTNALHLHV